MISKNEFIEIIFEFISLSLFYSGPIDCVWSGYGSWSRCSVTCGDGLQQRKRKILQQARNGGKRCEGNGIDTRTCSKAECPGMYQLVL